MSFLYRNKSVRRYGIGPNMKFMFKDYELRISDLDPEVESALNDEFLACYKELPVNERMQIVIVNEVAVATAETTLEQPVLGPSTGVGGKGPGKQAVIRGAASADDLLTDADRERIAKVMAGQQTGDAPLGGNVAASLNPNPAPASPFAGFKIDK